VNQQSCPIVGDQSTQRCVLVQWPWARSAYNQNHGNVPYPSWHGAILEGQRDRSGLQYKRNRQYDPGTGRFTQEDPIGLAGGLNTYGFAAGDPISFSDPFGLKVCVTGATQKSIADAKAALADAVDAKITWIKNCAVGMIKPGTNTAFRGLQTNFQLMINSGIVFTARLGGPNTSPQPSYTDIVVQADVEKHGYYTGAFFTRNSSSCDGGYAPFSMGQAFAHELSHRFPFTGDGQMNDEDAAIETGESRYLDGRQRLARCDHRGAY
jgi:RHS repeat-associated protein